ncbi:MAG: hypothetical protein ACXW32_17340 [Limisphaerales bacterium]
MIAKERSVQKPVRRAQIAHVREKGLHATIVGREMLREFHITVEPLPGESTEFLVRRLHSFVTNNSARIIRQEAFGSNAALEDLSRVQANRFGEVVWPVSSVQAFSCEQAPLAGLHVFAISGPQVEPLWKGNRVVGNVFSDGFARHCILGDVVSEESGSVREKRTLEIFREFASHLRSAGMKFTDLARTWLFLDDILSWYQLFNKERRETFEKFHVFDHCVPASTGIGAANPHGAALLAGGWAVQALGSSAKVQAVESPLQCSARDYGSCFSRAVEIATPDLRRLLISGTASIASDGATQFVGNVCGQVARTMEVVEAILTSRGMRWRNASRATVYLRNAGDAWAFCDYVQEHELILPTLVTKATVCRNDLLFEIEVDALASGQGASAQDWEI